MSQGEGNILLYGATGFSGALIAAEGETRGMTRQGNVCRMTVAARNGRELRKVAKRHNMDFRVFGLDSRQEIVKQLDGFKTVINAAGPFALTANALATAALEAHCHYVDINGELDVYRNIDDLGPKADQRGVAIVSGAGATPAASDVLLDLALSKLQKGGWVSADKPLRAVRIAAKQSVNITRGSAASIARSLRDQVAVVRLDPKVKSPKPEEQMRASHEPVGKLERAFDFGPRPDGLEPTAEAKGPQPKQARLRIACAVNMIDTLTAKHTLVRRGLKADRIETYLEMGALGRISYQAGALLSPFISSPWGRAVTAAQLRLLPDQLTQSELKGDRHDIVLEIEDELRQRVVDWRWRTPNVYEFTAQLTVGVAAKITKSALMGWVTPAEALGEDSLTQDPAFRECDKIEERQSTPLL
jgi:short subunit dehydrogenase-like uncharacterized protein